MKFKHLFNPKPVADESTKVISRDAEAIFAQKRNAKLTNAYYHIKKRMVIIAYLLVTMVISLTYLISPLSKTPDIIVRGNHYLSDVYALRLVKSHTSDLMLLNIPPLIEYELSNSAWIESATVKILDNGALQVDIVEKQPLGYYMNEMDEPYVLFVDGSTTPLNSYTTDMLSSIPLIHDFPLDALSDLANAFESVSSTMIESMAEIVRLSTSYDDNMIQILMADGNYFIGSRFSMETLNHYLDIINRLEGNGHCIYSTDGNEVVYTSSCPWEPQPEREPDYFLDCDGNPILDEAGNPIEIQYQTDANGDFIYDNRGNKTIINPIELPNCELEAQEEENADGNTTTDDADQSSTDQTTQ